MPCYDPYENNQIRTVYVDRDNPNDKAMIEKLFNENKKLEAGLCAIITELERKGIANEIISQASKSGLIDLMSFWAEHSKEDETRLAKKFHSFSEHEQEMIKKMFKDGKI